MKAKINDPIRIAAVANIRQTVDLCEKEQMSPKAVHSLRVTTKILRAYLRTYPGDVSIREANLQLKRLADQYAGVRDRYVLGQTLTALIAAWPRRKRKQYKALIDSFTRYTVHPVAADVQDSPRAAFDVVLQAWPSVEHNSRLWAEGLDRVYLKAQSLGAAAIKGKADEPYHRWRKWVKYWLYGLSGLAHGKTYEGYHKRLKRLGDSLGHFHDLCVLEEMLESPVMQVEYGEQIKPFLKAINIEKKALKKSYKKAHKLLFNLGVRKRAKMIG